MYQAALPFIGFGFFDNLIMITAVSLHYTMFVLFVKLNECSLQGEYIDSTIGITLGISTMAGKLISRI